MATRVSVVPTSYIESLSTGSVAQNKTSASRVLHLPHPRTAASSIFISHSISDPSKLEAEPTSALLEVQSVSPLSARSWFLKDEVVADGNLLIMTPVDPAFLLLPLLQSLQPTEGRLGNFQPIDDLFDELLSRLGQNLQEAPNLEDGDDTVSIDDLRYFLNLPCTKSACSRLCDVKVVGVDIEVCRFSQEKTLEYLRAKVARLVDSVSFRESKSVIRALAKDGLMEDGKEHLLEAARVRSACELLGQYLPTTLRDTLTASYASGMQELEAHYAIIEQENAVARALAAPKGNGKTKKSEADKVENGAKKRKPAAKASQGVEKLKKVNTTGMSKLSSFFTKKA